MAGVLAKVLGAVDHVALAAEVVDSVRNALRVDTLLGALAEVFLFREAGTIFNAILEHHARLLAEGRVQVLVRLSEPLPHIFNETHVR
jgi:hypothetical protein